MLSICMTVKTCQLQAKIHYIRKPDIRPFLVSGIRLARYRNPGRISGSSIHKIVDMVSNDNYFLSCKIETIELKKKKKLKRKRLNFSIEQKFSFRIRPDIYVRLGRVSGIRKNYWPDIWHADIRLISIQGNTLFHIACYQRPNQLQHETKRVDISNLPLSKLIIRNT